MARPNMWRGSALPVRLFFFDALAAIPLLVVFVHFRQWTIIVAVSWFVIFGLLSRIGYRPAVALRRIRTWLAGPVSYGRPWWTREQERP